MLASLEADDTPPPPPPLSSVDWLWELPSTCRPRSDKADDWDWLSLWEPSVGDEVLGAPPWSASLLVAWSGSMTWELRLEAVWATCRDVSLCTDWPNADAPWVLRPDPRNPWYDNPWWTHCGLGDDVWWKRWPLVRERSDVARDDISDAVVRSSSCSRLAKNSIWLGPPDTSNATISTERYWRPEEVHSSVTAHKNHPHWQRSPCRWNQ